jgi:hypothetical protein
MLGRAAMLATCDLSGVRLGGSEIYGQEDDHGLPLPEVQGGVACAARRGADSRVSQRKLDHYPLAPRRGPDASGSPAASHAARPPASSLTRLKPRCRRRLAPIDDRYPPAQ